MGDGQPIPFSAGEASGLDELSGASPALINCLPDAAGALHVRPGIKAWPGFSGVTLPAAIIGLYPWRQWILIVCEDRSLWAWEAAGSVLNLSYSLGGTGRPVFTYDQSRVVVTGGGMPAQWQGAGAASDLAPGQTDPSGAALALTHIAYSAQRFIGSVNSAAGFLQWTAPGQGNHATWPIVGPFYSEAEAAPDPVVALYANSNEVFAFGTETTQVYVPDPTIAFSVAASQQKGCAAPYSVINTDTDFAWLTDDKDFVTSGGRDFNQISSPGMSKSIANLDTISDCWGARIKFDTWDLLAWSFPTEKRTLYYDRVTQKWGEFRSTNDNGEWIAWLPTSYLYTGTFAQAPNVHLVGLENGTIGELTMDATTDMGATLRGFSRTGFTDFGTFNRKVCQRVDFQLRRDAATGTTATDPRMQYRYRDDLGAWSNPDDILLGGSYQPVVTKWSKGMFIQRQHEISFSNASNFILTGASLAFADTGS